MATADGKCRMSICIFLSICWAITRYHVGSSIRNEQSWEFALTWSNAAPRLSGCWPQERQERVGLSHFRSDVAAVGGGSGRSGNRFCRIVLGGSGARSAGGRKPGVEWERRILCRTDVVIGSLRRGMDR